jgi:hypothetical protein
MICSKNFQKTTIKIEMTRVELNSVKYHARKPKLTIEIPPPLEFFNKEETTIPTPIHKKELSPESRFQNAKKELENYQEELKPLLDKIQEKHREIQKVIIGQEGKSSHAYGFWLKHTRKEHIAPFFNSRFNFNERMSVFGSKDSAEKINNKINDYNSFINANHDLVEHFERAKTQYEIAGKKLDLHNEELMKAKFLKAGFNFQSHAYSRK